MVSHKNGIPSCSGECEQRAENAGVHRGGEQIQHTGPIAVGPPGMEQRPPEQQLGPQKTGVLGRVNANTGI